MKILPICDAADVDVLIVGAGPVGLTLATDLTLRSISTLSVETRAYGELPSVKSNHVSARSMEVFRRLGVADQIRSAGLPPRYPVDVVFRTTMTGIELSRIPIPCREDRLNATDSLDATWPTAEPPHRINQIFLEPILLDHAVNKCGVKLWTETRLTGFVQSDQGVTATVVRNADGEEVTVRARYLVGCDGSRSLVRRGIGARFEGEPVVQRVQSTYIHAPTLRDRIKGAPGWYNYSLNPRRCGAVIAVNGLDRWIVHNHLNPSEVDFESIDRDKSIRDILGVGSDFRYEVLSREDWIGRALVADRIRADNVFIAGDAAHLWVPYAGYGMNAGIADATNLAWLLAARLQGWGGSEILDAYQAERQPITRQVSVMAMEHARKVMSARQAIPTEIENDDAGAAALRAEIGKRSCQLNAAQFACGGLNFGYYYQGSPIIVEDEETAPPYSMGDFVSSTVPGCRAPHFWLQDGRSVYDALGPGYTLLQTSGHAEIARIEAACAARGVPLVVLDLSNEALPPEYSHALLICRSDQHIAWRGNAQPDDADALVAQLCAA
ncbi:2-polyprenyl-6-methoxyphenol hydroxylase-like FAD-dependent oxidoreductase [Novosphingobium hassiacum]|uniref:2-polyprenyl-6-methoxyphenol hydroxylase-like FAD-dependent oxidoreductase n=1 Tax=Novosphingobium hassiacum TaxID=173676 RepID=A0A7W6A304_9SPHN|nr:FAD-dependent oxidoreductase [Novosphingobium hassiacum]MBB3862335.1 2-polyprenyl-6-methoxyphenol hydroxylase-like FAD-dependent oxidoreductase [Novosphingobium hassiacum]